MITLAQALRIRSSSRIAIVGAGGKTSALFQMARETAAPVLLTTSTHLGAWQTTAADQHFIVSSPAEVLALADRISGVTLITGPEGQHQKLNGLDTASLQAVQVLGDRLNCPVILEADGSRTRPLKAPGAHEPVIPPWVDQVMVVAGLSGIGQVLEANSLRIHRPERFAELAGLVPGSVIGPGDIVRVVSHPQGGLKNIPLAARRVVLLNQADSAPIIQTALEMAGDLLAEYDAVVVSSLQSARVWAACQCVAGILLAGGSSTRLGQPKGLLSWHGKPLVRHVVETALAGGLSRMVVVLGAVDAPIRQALEGLPVTFAANPDWTAGQSTSVKTGLRAAQQLCLPRELGAALFFLMDQPFITPDLVNALVGQHRRSQASTIAPQVNGKRTNPVLFDSSTFFAFADLQGDMGGRGLFERFPPELLPWQDPRLSMDIDTPADYQRLLGME